jgi:hypothetical protein
LAIIIHGFEEESKQKLRDIYIFFILPALKRLYKDKPLFKETNIMEGKDKEQGKTSGVRTFTYTVRGVDKVVRLQTSIKSIIAETNDCDSYFRLYCSLVAI